MLANDEFVITKKLLLPFLRRSYAWRNWIKSQ